MPQINPNINNSYSPAPQAIRPRQSVQLPAYYNTADYDETPDFKEMLKENPVYDLLIKNFMEHPAAVILTWLGLGIGFDAYSKANRGNYEGSLVQKAANLGDRIETSKLVQSKPIQSVLNRLNKLKKGGGRIVQNNSVLRAIKETPARPEWGIAKSQMFNQKQEVVQDFIKIADTLGLGAERSKPVTLGVLGLDKSEKEMLKKVFNSNKISQIPESEAVSQVLLHRLGRTPEQIKEILASKFGADTACKNEILKEMGLTAEKIELIKKDYYGKYTDDVFKAVEKVKDKVKIGAGHYNWMGAAAKPFERTMSCGEVYNKLHSMGDGAKTATGRFTSKLMQMIHRGITFGGGKLGLLIFIAPSLVDVALSVKKADSDRKIGTLANGLVESVSWVFTFPLAAKMIYHFAGARYAGMNKEQVEQYRKTVENFNEKVKSCRFKNSTDYKAAKKSVKAELKKISTVKGQNILTRGVRNLAKFLTMDLETLKSKNFFGKIPNFFKNVAGVPMRFGLWSLVSMGVLGAILTKCTTAIFGKYYDPMKNEEHEAEKKKQEQFLRDDLKKRLYETAAQKQADTVRPINNNTVQAKAYSSRGLNQHAYSGRQEVNTGSENRTAQNIPLSENKSPDNYTYIPSQENIIPRPINKGKIDNYTYIPSSECMISGANSAVNPRKYIPSQTAANIPKNFDNSGLQSALDRAQRAEDRALKILAGNFDGM